MSSRMNLKAKRELVRVVSEKYQCAEKRDKRKILDQFVAVTGYHRKHSIRLLNSTAELVAPRRTRRFRVLRRSREGGARRTLGGERSDLREAAQGLAPPPRTRT